MGNKQDQFPTQTGEVTTPLTQFTQNIMGTLVITVKPKAKTMQTKMSTQQMPIQPDFYLPNGKGSRLSEIHQIKTTEKSPEGHPAVLIILENWPMATLTVERTKEQVGLEKQNNIAIEKEPEQQVEDEQWEFIRYEVEKMKEA